MRNLFIVPIEPIETRYTKHWYEFFPEQFQKNLRGHYNVRQIEVPWGGVENTPGAFLNFTATADYKATQISWIASMFSSGEVKENDVFLFTDYWNPCASMVRYMSALMGISVKMVGICHAGYWDTEDFLYKKLNQGFYKDTYHYDIMNRDWMISQEKTLDKLYDVKIFSTEFSKSLYEKSIGAGSENNLVTGFPMEYYDRVMPRYWELKEAPAKENIVVFPHRKAPEKGYSQFLELEKRLPQYRFIVAMDVCKTKEEYHQLLYRSKLAVSMATQETLGISMGIEVLRAGCNVIVPDDLSYKEIFTKDFKFKRETFRYTDITKLIDEKMQMKQSDYMDAVKVQCNFNENVFFNGRKLYEALKYYV